MDGAELAHWVAHVGLALLLAVATSVIAKLLVDRRRENEIKRLLHIIDGRLAAVSSRLDRPFLVLEEDDDAYPHRDERGRFKRKGA